MDRIVVDYLVCRPAKDAEKVARYIAYEQTVELPEGLVTSAPVREGVVGRVEAVRPSPGSRDSSVVTMSFDQKLSGLHLSQLLNLLYGNISIQHGIRLLDFRLPEPLLDRFPGPNFGLEGLRRLLGVRGRPLLATALKPMGASVRELASIAGRFASGGGDIVKDDQNLADGSRAAFRERISRCQEAVAAANARTGRRTQYFPVVSAPHGEIEERIEFSRRLGIRGVLICPLLLGFDHARHLAEKYGIVFMAHPSFTGAFFHDRRHGFTPAALLGKLMRLAGADISIFPNFGGRFSFTREECAGIAARLREPWGRLRPAFPAPAGGMRLDSLGGMADDYGPDAVFLVGGSLLGHEGGVEAGTRVFQRRIAERFEERSEAPGIV